MTILNITCNLPLLEIDHSVSPHKYETTIVSCRKSPIFTWMEDWQHKNAPPSKQHRATVKYPLPPLDPAPPHRGPHPSQWLDTRFFPTNCIVRGVGGADFAYNEESRPVFRGPHL